MPSYHFDVGNSSTGPIGLCGRITAKDREEAVKIFQRKLDEHTGLEGEVTLFDNHGEPDEYINVYINPEAITEKDIDESDEGDKAYPWSVLYVHEGSIQKLGPFKDEEEATTAAVKAYHSGAFDVAAQVIYLLAPGHRLQEMAMIDFEEEE